MAKAVVGGAMMDGMGDDNAVRCTGSLLRFLLRGEQSCDDFALVERLEHRGSEPQVHASDHEVEAVYILEGELAYLVKGERLCLARGASVVLPRGVQYSYSLISARARLHSMTMPSRSEDNHRDMGQPLGRPEAYR
jgi:mannose-6-phosphate isomerase-like protein (cupin superfamily)